MYLWEVDTIENHLREGWEEYAPQMVPWKKIFLVMGGWVEKVTYKKCISFAIVCVLCAQESAVN